MGVVSTDERGGRSLGGVEASVEPDPQHPPPPEPRRRDRREDRPDPEGTGLPDGAANCGEDGTVALGVTGAVVKGVGVALVPASRWRNILRAYACCSGVALLAKPQN